MSRRGGRGRGRGGRHRQGQPPPPPRGPTSDQRPASGTAASEARPDAAAPTRPRSPDLSAFRKAMLTGNPCPYSELEKEIMERAGREQAEAAADILAERAARQGPAPKAQSPAGAGAEAPPTVPSPPPTETPRAQAWRKARMSADRRRRLYPKVSAQQGGEYCVICDRSPDDLALAGRNPTLCIDHADNDPRHNDLRNLQLLCRSCNTKKNHPVNTPTIVKRAPGPELSINRRAEPAFRHWLFEQFYARPDYQYARRDLLNDAAAFVEVSQDTIARYLGKATSRYGIYKEAMSSGGEVYVELRPEYR